MLSLEVHIGWCLFYGSWKAFQGGYAVALSLISETSCHLLG